MSRRLEYVRTKFSGVPLSLAEFHRLLGGEELVSYQTVQNYHFDRDASIEYLVAVTDVFSVNFEWLATGRGSPTPWGAPGLKGEIDPATNAVLHHLTDPEEREFEEWYQARIRELRFLGPLVGTPMDHVIETLTGALDDRRTREDMEPMTLQDWKERNLRVIAGLDQVLGETWMRAVAFLDSEISFQPSRLSLDQQLQFGQALILSILALLPDRDLAAPAEALGVEACEIQRRMTTA